MSSSSYLSDLIASAIYLSSNPKFSKSVPTEHTELGPQATPAQLITVQQGLHGLNATEQVKVVDILTSVMKSYDHNGNYNG